MQHKIDSGASAPEESSYLLSLAAMFEVEFSIDWLEELTGNRMEVIHVVGGGSKSAILNQFTADACQRPVVAGPVEATAMGNLLVQVRANGELNSLAEMREVIRNSSEVATRRPVQPAAWEDAGARFAGLRGGA